MSTKINPECVFPFGSVIENCLNFEKKNMAFCPSKCEDGVTVAKPKCLEKEMFVREKRLMGPGPSNPTDRVLRALSRPMMGHLHPETLQVSTCATFDDILVHSICGKY